LRLPAGEVKAAIREAAELRGRLAVVEAQSSKVAHEPGVGSGKRKEGEETGRRMIQAPLWACACFPLSMLAFSARSQRSAALCNTPQRIAAQHGTAQRSATPPGFWPIRFFSGSRIFENFLGGPVGKYRCGGVEQWRNPRFA
jgi:hypothetical protein